MFLDYGKVDLRAPCIDVLAKSLRLTWISRLLSDEEMSNESWKAIPNYLFEQDGGLNFILWCNYSKKFLERINLPQFYKLILRNFFFFSFPMYYIYCSLRIFYQRFTTMKYKNKIQIGFLFRNYRLKGGFYIKDKKVFIISSLLCHRFAIKNKHEDQEGREKKKEQKNTQQQ